MVMCVESVRSSSHLPKIGGKSPSSPVGSRGLVTRTDTHHEDMHTGQTAKDKAGLGVEDGTTSPTRRMATLSGERGQATGPSSYHGPGSCTEVPLTRRSFCRQGKLRTCLRSQPQRAEWGFRHFLDQCLAPPKMPPSAHSAYTLTLFLRPSKLIPAMGLCTCCVHCPCSSTAASLSSLRSQLQRHLLPEALPDCCAPTPFPVCSHSTHRHLKSPCYSVCPLPLKWVTTAIPHCVAHYRRPRTQHSTSQRTC